MAHAALLVERATGSARSHLPRVARTGVTGTPRIDLARCTASTMSPPWLTSTTSASASSRRNSATAARRPARRPSALDAWRRRAHARCRRVEAGRDDAAGVRPLPRRRRRVDRDDDAHAAAAPRRRGTPRSSARDHSASARSSIDLAVELLPAEPRAGVARRRRRRGTPARGCRRWPRVAARRHDRRAGRPSAASAAASAAAWSSPPGAAASPSRRPNCSMSQVSCGRCHLASSSNQAASNCGPRRLSGSSAENTCATRRSARAGAAATAPSAAAPPAVHRQQARDTLDHHLADIGEGLADERDAARGPRCEGGGRAPPRAPIRRRCASCRRRARPAPARRATACRRAPPRAASGRTG